MISVPRVIDTHRHVWDTRLRRYPWLDEEPSMPQGHLSSDAEDPRVSAAVFVEAGTENGVDEARWVQALADSGQWPQLVGIVAAAPVDDPAALSAVLDDLQVLPLFVGMRRLLQDEPPGTLASARFREGLVELGARSVPFDACIRSRQLIELAGLVAGAPGTRIVLDHLGKPPVGWIRERPRANVARRPAAPRRATQCLRQTLRPRSGGRPDPAAGPSSYAVYRSGPGHIRTRPADGR